MKRGLAITSAVFLAVAVAVIYPVIRWGWAIEPAAFWLPAAGCVLAGLAAALFPKGETAMAPRNPGRDGASEPVRGGTGPADGGTAL